MDLPLFQPEISLIHHLFSEKFRIQIECRFEGRKPIIRKQQSPSVNRQIETAQVEAQGKENILSTMGSNESKRNLIIVSNRLPLSIKRANDTYQSSISSGGLVTALSGLTKSTEFRWFGWPGIEVRDVEERKKVAQSLDEHDATPIFLDKGLAHEHYNMFSSKP